MAIKYYYFIIGDVLYTIACDDEMKKSLNGFELEEIPPDRYFWNVFVDLMFDEPNKIKMYKIIEGELYKLWSK